MTPIPERLLRFQEKHEARDQGQGHDPGDDSPERLPTTLLIFPDLHERAQDKACREPPGMGIIIRPDEEAEKERVQGPADGPVFP